MKRSTILLSVLICIFASAIQATAKTIKPTLHHATIYFQGAELTYKDNIQLLKGENEIRLTGLSPNLDKNSIRISASKSAVVNAYEYTIDYLSDNPKSKYLKQWNDSLEICNAKILELDDNIANRESVLEILKINTSKSKDGDLNFDILMKYADYYQTKGTELMGELRKFRKQRNELSTTVNRISNQIQEENRNNKPQGVLVIKLNALTNTMSDLKLVYYTQNASWTPYYDIVANKINEPILFKYKAKVLQNTGVDWDNVTLRLTTTMPTFGKTAPLLRAWFVDFYQPISALGMSAKRMLPTMSMQNSYSYDKKDMAEDVVQEDITISDYITQGENDISQTFDISLAYSIPGNGREQYIDLIQKNVTADFSYYTVPKMGEEAYLLAEIPNWESLGLLSGSANITFGDTFMGTTFIDTKSTLDKLALTLGVDDRISIKREKTQDFSSKKTFGSNIVQAFNYKITVKNNQSQTIKLVVKDQYPISSNKDIKIERLKQTTTPSKTNEDVGVLVWELDLAPGTSKEFTNAFSVQYPKDKPINF